MARKNIVISNQSEFDSLSTRLVAAMSDKDKDIYVSFTPSQYEFKDRHIDLHDIDAPDKNIHFIGNGAILVPDGQVYYNGDSYLGHFSPSNSWMYGDTDLDFWSDMRYADGQVEILNAKKKECRIKAHDFFPEGTDYSNAYILVTQWYVSGVYKITTIKGQYIYFVDDDLSDGHKMGYSINNDYNYRGTNPRYKVCNINDGEDRFGIINGKVILPKSVPSVREGISNRFAVIQSCNFKSIEFSGFRIMGCSNNKQSSAINVDKVGCDFFSVNECEFAGFRSSVISFSATPNVLIENNKFKSCYLYGIQAKNSCKNTIVKYNEFLDMGKGMMNTRCVACKGTNFLILGNKFTDYGYSGIGVGEWYKAAKNSLCTGVVENNILTFTDDYLSKMTTNGLMDSGAIYLSTKSDGIVIRNNRIDGFSGAGSNRGIFCDDGAYNFTIIGNVITRVANSYCIDSRRCAYVEERNTAGTNIVRANVNIEIRNNFIEGRIRFVGHEDSDNGCVLGNNYLLSVNNYTTVDNVIEHVNYSGTEHSLVVTGEKKGKLGIARKSYRQARHLPEWRKIKKFFLRNNG